MITARTHKKAHIVWQSLGPPSHPHRVGSARHSALKFKDRNQVGGSGGCNTFGAQCGVSDGMISFAEIVSTLTGCTAEGVMERKEAYYKAVRTAREFELIDDELRIRYSDGQGVLNSVCMGPP